MSNTHHTYSPSGLRTKELCPCFEQDETRSTAAADEGTLMHGAAETGDLGKLETEEQEEAVQMALAYAEKLVEQLQESWDGVVGDAREVKVSIDGLTEGTVDRVLTAGIRAIVLDYKFGRTPVDDAEINIQGQSYVVGVFEEYPELEEIKLIFLAPRIDYVTEATYTRKDIPRIRKRIAAIISRCEDPAKEPTPCEKACAYCGGKAQCPALSEVAFSVGETLPVPVTYDPGQLVNPQEMAKALVLSSLLEDWAKQVRRSVTKAVVEEGMEVPGFTLRSRAGAHEVTEVFDAIQTVLGTFESLDISVIMQQACSLSLPKLADIIAATTGETKKDTRERILELLSPYWIQRDTVTYLQRKKGITDEEIIQGHA
jgi:hypothetical protein